MVLKGRLHNRLILAATVVCLLTISSCSNAEKQRSLSTSMKDYSIDTLGIPHDTVLTNDPNLSLTNGLYLYKSKLYSGYILDLYPNKLVKKQMSIYQGMLHGCYKSYYENGKAWETRSYKNNLSTGKHYGFWAENGNPKFEYNYYQEKMEGVQKKWYPSGKQYLVLNYVNDHEDGFQKGWRENGKLFLNYEVKDGIRYGLQKAVLCYTLRDEKLNSTTE